MDKLNKLLLSATIIIASLILGGFFYASQVSKQRSIERQQEIKLQEERARAEQEKLDQLAAELKEQEAKEQAGRALDTCIAIAEESHSNWWYRNCVSQGKLTSRCALITNLTFYEYAQRNNIPTTTEEYQTEALNFEKEKDECSCSLPFANADRINESLDKAKAECLKRYPQK